MSCGSHAEVSKFVDLSASTIQEAVQQHYGSGHTSVCQTFKIGDAKLAADQNVQAAKELIHPEVTKRYFGCSDSVPPFLGGCTVLDLGCGAGRDCFIVSKCVGETGRVVGLDMTRELLNIAEAYKSYHAEKFGFKASNVEFVEGRLEEMEKLVGEEKFDVIISNCVINLCADKGTIFRKAFDVLKPGGEMYFSDVYCSETVGEEIRRDKLAWNEGFGGALAWHDFEALIKAIGFYGPFVVTSASYSATDAKIKQLIGELKFWSRTCRLIKPSCTERSSSSRQSCVTYSGGGTDDALSSRFVFAQNAVFERSQVATPESEVLAGIAASRYGKYFLFAGNK